jgi:plastocyanin
LSELYYKRALQIDPTHQGATGYLGELYVQTNQLGLARETLDKLKMMCPPPNDCVALGVLRYAMSVNNVVEGAFVRDVAWNDCFDLACSPMNITVGDTLNFVYSEAHDVVKVADAAAFETCADGVTVGATDAGAGYEHRFENEGVEYFVCSQGSHCANGQKMVVNVHSARTTPSAGGEAPSYSLQAEVQSGARQGVRGGALAAAAAAAVVALMSY